MKKNYMKPTMDVVNMQIANMICASDKSVTNVSGSGLKYGGAGNDVARSRGGDWDDED